MAPASGSKLNLTVLRLLPLLPVLPLLPGSAWAGRAETHSLSYDFTITPKFTPGQHWCEVQGRMDGKTFLQGNCGNKNFKPCGLLGKEINSKNTWEEQMETLSNVVEELRKELLDFQLENHTPREPLTVEVRMSCQREANGHTNGSWQFGFDGQVFLVFGSESRKWTLTHPGARHMKEKWEDDTDVTKFFYNILIGDCMMLLTDFLTHWEKLLQTTETHVSCNNFTSILNYTLTPEKCEVQRHVDCSNTIVKTLSPPEKGINGTKAWVKWIETERDLIENLIQEILQLPVEKHTTRDPVTLEVRTPCYREANGHIRRPFQSICDERMFKKNEFMNRSCSLVHDAVSQRKMWKNDRNATISIKDLKREFEDLLILNEIQSTEARGTRQNKIRVIMTSISYFVVISICFLVICNKSKPLLPSP
ncbi:uncharacterized protein LOC105858054 isoform X2 [Microcebus murinus]|uniref:uncharacterized protein LOC105858054 isoform X2 n=1 Tax=Microcebus murinus TaxID=30608 RepID=UPI003F6ADC5D